MPPSLFEISVKPFIGHLHNIKKLIEKGVDEIKDEAKITESKLIDDMGNFCYQIKCLSDISKGFVIRLGKAEKPDPAATEDTDTTIPELIARIDSTIEFLEKLSPDCFDDIEKKALVLGGGTLNFTTSSFIVDMAIPSFYFHYCMAYALLRKEGVNIGKSDYLGSLGQ